MQQSLRHQALIVLVAAIVFLTMLGATRLWDQDEAFFARTAVEMQQRHDWVVPYFNGDVFAHKPPMMYWAMGVSTAVFGTTEFAVRLPSAVFAIGTSLLVYHLGKRLFNACVGLWAAIALCTALNFDVVARAATPDSLLVFFCTLPLLIFARREQWTVRSSAAIPAGTTQRSIGISFWTYSAMYAAMGCAVLVKGPIGVLLPGCVIGLYLLTRDPIAALPKDATFGGRVTRAASRFTPTRVWAAFWQMRPFTAIAAVLLVAGPWFALVAFRTHGAFLREFFGTQNFGRFVGPLDNHGGPIWYYIPAILVGFFPWSIFGIPTAIELVRRCRILSADRRAARFIACWIIVIVGFFSLAGTKLPSYVLPAYPALALATACFLDRWLAQPETVNRWWPRLSFGSMLAVGMAIAIAVPIAAHTKLHGRPLIEQLGLPSDSAGDLANVSTLGGLLIAGGVAGIALAERKLHRRALVGLSATAVAFSLLMLSVFAVRFDRYKPIPELAEFIAQHADGAPHVAEFGYFRPSLVYYTDGRVEACGNLDRLIEFLHDAEDAFVVTTRDAYDKVTSRLPADVAVVNGRPDFPGAGTVLVLARPAAIARSHADASRW